MKEHNLKHMIIKESNANDLGQNNIMPSHREESNANDLEQNNIMQSHREESNENQNKFVQRKSDGRVESLAPKEQFFFFFLNYKQAGE